jgi:hypothetical protein
MLEISLITVLYKRIGKFWYITQSELNSCKWSSGERNFFSLKGTTFVYVLSSDWLNYWFDT